MLSYHVSVPRRESVCLDRSLCIVLAFCCIQVPKMVPLLELFSSKAGTFSVLRKELFSSKAGTLRFQRRNFHFPLKERLDEVEAGAEPMQEALDESVT